MEIYKKEEIKKGGIPKGALCYDCEKELKKDDNYATYFLEDKKISQDLEIAVFKCEDCYIKDPKIHHGGEDILTYKRIVGYMTPKSQWNVGKLAEDDQRVNFKIKLKTFDSASKKKIFDSASKN